MLITLALTLFTQRNFVADFRQWSAILDVKRPFASWAPFGGGATYDVILDLWKACSGLSVSINWTFSLGVTTEALRANIYWKSAFSLQRGQFVQKFQVERVTPTNHSSCQKTRMNDLSCGIRMWAKVSFVLSQSTRLADRQTDGQKGLGNTVRCITCSRTVKIVSTSPYITCSMVALTCCNKGDCKSQLSRTPPFLAPSQSRNPLTDFDKKLAL